LKQKHPALQLPLGQLCKTNQSSSSSHLFNEDFKAHEALEDAVALQNIIFKSPLQLSKENIINCSAAISDILISAPRTASDIQPHGKHWNNTVDGPEHCGKWTILFQSQGLVLKVGLKGIVGNPKYAF